MSNPRPSAEAIVKGSSASARRAAEERAYKFEEARHLMRFGIDPDQIASQLGTTRLAMERLAQRHDAPEVARYMRPGRLRGVCDTCSEPTTKPTARECRECYRLRKAEGQWSMQAIA